MIKLFLGRHRSKINFKKKIYDGIEDSIVELNF